MSPDFAPKSGWTAPPPPRIPHTRRQPCRSVSNCGYERSLFTLIYVRARPLGSVKRSGVQGGV